MSSESCFSASEGCSTKQPEIVFMSSDTQAAKTTHRAICDVVQVLDPALTRPGRLSRRVVVPLPDEAGRADILAVHLRKTPMTSDADKEFCRHQIAKISSKHFPLSVAAHFMPPASFALLVMFSMHSLHHQCLCQRPCEYAIVILVTVVTANLSLLQSSPFLP